MRGGDQTVGAERLYCDWSASFDALERALGTGHALALADVRREFQSGPVATV